MVAKKKTTKKQAKPKTKVVYRTKKVYVEKRARNDDDDAFHDTREMLGWGVGAIVGIGVANALVNAVK
jgi:hypothetical protein